MSSSDIVVSATPAMPAMRGVLKPIRYGSLPDPYSSNDGLFKEAMGAYDKLCLHFGVSRADSFDANAFADSPAGSFDRLVADFKTLTQIAGARMIIIHGAGGGFEKIDPAALAYAIIIQGMHISAKDVISISRKDKLVALRASVEEQDNLSGLKRCRVTSSQTPDSEGTVHFSKEEKTEVVISSRFMVALKAEVLLSGCSKKQSEVFYICLKSAVEWNKNPLKDGITTVGRTIFELVSKSPCFSSADLEVAADKLKCLVDFLDDNHYGVFGMKGSRGPCTATMQHADACLEVASRILAVINQRKSAGTDVVV